MNRVIDCSIAFKWVVPESDSGKAIRLREDYRTGAVDLLVPDLFPTEVANAIIMAERRGRIAAGQALLLIADVLNTLPMVHPALPDLLPRACEIAAQSVVTVYDCLYVALAERESCELVTADARLLRNLQQRFPFIVDLSSLP